MGALCGRARQFPGRDVLEPEYGFIGSPTDRDRRAVNDFQAPHVGLQRMGPQQ
jgi:hypothetical protein